MKLTIIQDSREKRPVGFSEAVEVKVAALDAGDYSLAGFEDQVAVERKSLSDLIGSITSGRDRFTRELARLRCYRFAAIVIEARWEDILMGTHGRAVHPNAVMGTLMSFSMKYGIHIVMAGDHQTGAELTERLLRCYARQVERDFKRLSSGSAMVEAS